jgi:nicotinamide riboside transporter PnuC
MTNQVTGKYASGFGLALMIMLVFNGLVVIVKEKADPLMNAMKAATGHHWITHGIVVIVLFLILGLIFSALQPAEKPWLDAKKIVTGTIVSAIIGYVLIVGFYLIIG